MKNYVVHNGNALSVLKRMDSESVDCVVTSPPYFGLRRYDHSPSLWCGDLKCSHNFKNVSPIRRRNKESDLCGDKQVSNTGSMFHLNDTAECVKCGAWKGRLGEEPTPGMFVEHLALICDEIYRVLKNDGTFWLNISDSYSGSGKAGNNPEYQRRHTQFGATERKERLGRVYSAKETGVQPKSLCLIPQRLVIALQERGWIVRSDIIWHKKTAMPEPVKDRPTRSYEHIFLLSKQGKYYFDQNAIMEEAAYDGRKDTEFKGAAKYADDAFLPVGKCGSSFHSGPHERWPTKIDGVRMRNGRDVWVLKQSNFRGAHFATFPYELPERCIKAGCPEGGVVLDPFCGSGTTGVVALSLFRKFVGIELSEKYTNEFILPRLEKESKRLKQKELF